ncbi:TPA: hypothetical protein ACSQZH_003310 [Pseudomonas aeruginosa]|jgi:hypothetical protein
MTAGLRVVNQTGNFQIDQDYRNQRVERIYSSIPAKPYGHWLDISPVKIREECPLVFARTSGWIGGVTLQDWDDKGPTDGTLYFYSSAPVDIAICTVKYTPVSSSPALEVYDSSGRLVYSSSVRYPRIFTLIQFGGSLVSGEASYASDQTMPWICINPLVMSLSAPLGSGSDISFPPWMIAAQAYAGAARYKMVDSAYIMGDTNADVKLSPYYNRQMYIPLAVIPGT